MATATLAPAAKPVTTCACCDSAVRVGVTWCSWLCRNLDDRHDDYEPAAVDD